MKALYYIDGIQVNEPNNYPELEIELNNDKDGNKQAVSINSFEFGVHDYRNTNDAVGYLLNHIDKGRSGGVGVFEGKPLEIYLSDEINTSYRLFNGYLDLSKARVMCNKIVAPAVEQGNIDWLNDVADSVSFEYLYEIGSITNNDFISVPYCISKKVNSFEIMISLLSIFVMGQALYKEIVEISKSTSEAANPFQTVSAIVGLILEIVYIVLLLVAIVKTIIDLYNTLVQPVKYHNGMYVKDLLTIGCSHFGLTFSSTILQQAPFNKMLLLPEKYNLKEDNVGFFKNVIGNLTPNKNEKLGYYKGTFGDLLRAMKLMFNAKIVIKDGILNFEKQDFSIAPSLYKLPALVPSEYEFNHEEMYSNTIISFSLDFEDRNTVQEFKGTSCQIIQSPANIINKNMVLMKNIREVRIPFALGRRKTELTVIENFIDGFLNLVGGIIDNIINVINKAIKAVNEVIKLVNKIIKLLNKIGIPLGEPIGQVDPIKSPNIKNLIEQRIDMLKMETDFISIPKLILIDNNSDARNNKLLSGNETYLSAKYLYDNYHYFSNFVTTNGWNNQMLKKSFENIPFTFLDYEKVRLNSGIYDSDGNIGQLISLKFNPNKQTASGSYKIKYTYSYNININIIEPNE